MRFTAALVAALPWRSLRPLGSAIGLFAGSVLRIRRRHVEASLTAAGIAPAAAIARRMYASLGAGLCELLWLAGRPPSALADRFEMTPRCAEALRKARRDRGVVVATAHTGNWDLSACAAARWFMDDPSAPAHRAALTVVTKRLSWRALDRYWQRLRAERGVVLVDAAGAATAVRDALADGGVVALLVDQAPERASGVATLPFLGRAAKHDLAPALLAARAKVPIVVLLGHRRDDGMHVLDLAECIEPEDLRGRGAIEAATARISKALETFVRAHPEQWLWLHRRWK
ncbi:Lipid A biosynthesis lauroyl acyltransferase [Minicystis rosea]|nr:Lipid A biosynthesis lauroyl acyltransferase [Minicystis rosea]